MCYNFLVLRYEFLEGFVCPVIPNGIIFRRKRARRSAARGKIFTKIGREIAIAVREGGANPESNGKLRDIIAKAKANNMPNDNIQRSIKKAAGEGSGINYEEIVYEGYAPGGVAVIVQYRNR